MGDTKQHLKPPITPTNYREITGSYKRFSMPDFSLLGLDLEWKFYYDWSIRSGVGDVFILIRSGILFENHPPGSLAYVFRFLHRPDLRSVLKEWSSRNDTARDLYRLSRAIQADPEILSSLNAADERGTRQLHGNSSIRYLLGMLMSNPKEATEEQQNKLAVWKCWILFLGLQEAKEGYIQHTRLHSVATNLRLAEKPTHFSRNTFLDIFPDLLDLDLIGDDIHQKADSRIALLRKENALSARESTLLNAIKRLGKGILGREPYKSKSDISPSNYRLLLGIPGKEDSNVQFSETFLFDTGHQEPIDIPGTDSGRDLRSVGTQPESSYAEQKSDVVNTLLTEVGKHQFLPYSWNSLTPQEVVFLERWIENTLKSPSQKEQVLAVVVWIAMHTGQSLHYAMLTCVADGVPGKNWTLDPKGSRLFRVPPLRHDGWEPDGLACDCVTPVQTHIEIPLPETVANVLLKALPQYLKVSVLWEMAAQVMGLPVKKNPDATLRKYAKLFNKLTKSSSLFRVQPGMLGSVFPQTLFYKNEDAAFAHLLASRDDRGMPGNCAYPSWYLRDEQYTYTHLSVGRQASNLIHIGLGSRLDPIEQQLTETIEEAADQLQDIHNDNLLDYHNALTGYLMVAILAATGARPIKDLIESPRQIDFEQCFLFIEDKSTDARSDGRIVPLPHALCNYLRKDYLSYLEKLADRLDQAKAPHIAKELQQLAKGRESKRIPFLFLLTVTNSTLSWSSVSESSLEALKLFRWPLPWNLFRHRLAKQLRYRAVHPEIIDGLFGHVEATTTSWGSYSLRSWQQDMNIARPALEAVFDNLRLVLPDLPDSLPALKRSWSKESLLNEEFGRKARKSARKVRRKKVHAATELEIQRYVKDDANKEHLTELDEQQIEALSRKMMLLSNGPPRKNGWFRYSVLIDLLETAWREHGKKVRIKRRYARPFEEKSGFTHNAPQAQQLLDQIQSFALNPSLAKLLNRKSLYQNCVLGVLRLMAENRIADPAVLKDILFQRNYRLVQYRESTYLEYAPSLKKEDPGAAVQRYRISPTTAQILNHALKSKRRWKKDTVPPAWMNPLLETLTNIAGLPSVRTVVDVIKHLTPVVQQANLQQFPGVIAAYLNGHIHSISLSWMDWLRMDTGQQIAFGDKVFPEAVQRVLDAEVEGTIGKKQDPYEEGDEKDLSFPKDIQPVYSSNSWQKNDPEVLQSNARKFRKMLSTMLAEEEKKSPANSYEARDRIAREVTRLIQKNAEGVSSSILLLGRWITRMLFRQVRKGGKWHYITFSTLSRYLTEFGNVFCDLAYSIDLAIADQEVVTALYLRFIDQKTEEGQSYAFHRLMDFHDFVRDEDVVDPDWSELPRTAKRFSVSPGVILEQEYQDTLQLLLNQTGLSSDFRHAQAFILMAGYRFGTRGNEALGLRRKDWVDFFNPVELLIESNRARTLKNSASRRRVPLLFELSVLEKEILEHVFLDDQLRYGHEASPYLFDQALRAQEWRLMGGINQALKLITGNPKTVLHHTRHTAGNRMVMALFHPSLPQWWAPLQMDDLSQERIRKQLLMTRNLTRRTSWAGAFYLGHAGPKTTLHSYVHFVGDWSDQLLHIPNGLPDSPLDHAIVLDDFPKKAPVDTQLLSHITPPLDPVTPARVLKLLRHISLGKDCRFSAATLGIDGSTCEDLNKLLSSLFKKVRVKEEETADEERRGDTKKARISRVKKKKKPRRKKEPTNFLWQISIGGWQRLIDLAERSEDKSHLPPARIKVLELREVIGATRQILLWKKSHFAAFHAFVEYFNLFEVPYLLVHSPDIPEKRLKQAKKYGLESVSARSEMIKNTNKRGIELDRIQRGGSDGYHVKKRLAAILTRNQSGDIHGSYEWIALFIAWVVATSKSI